MSEDELEKFLMRKLDEFHAETWSAFRAGMKPSTSYLCAKEKENLVGEIYRKYHEIHCL